MEFDNSEFELPIPDWNEHRFSGVEKATDEYSMYRIFKRNMCHNLYVTKHREITSTHGFEFRYGKENFSVGMILENLYDWLKDDYYTEYISFTSFAEYELNYFYFNEKFPHYQNFLEKHLPIFRAIDALKIKIQERLYSEEFIEFLRHKHVSLDNINFKEIQSQFIAFEEELMLTLFNDYYGNLKIQRLENPKTTPILKTMYFHLNSRLITNHDKKGLHQWTALYFEQLLERVCFVMGFESWPREFDELNQKFKKSLPFHNVTEVPDYPNTIFSTYKAYALFDFIATRARQRVVFCFLYRYLFDKGLILVRDTPFRKWFNEQDYKLSLTDVTDTLDRCSTIDRELLIKLVADQIGLSLSGNQSA